MRENDDDAPVTGPEGSLADGVGETIEQGDHASSGDPYGDVDFDDDAYGDGHLRHLRRPRPATAPPTTAPTATDAGDDDRTATDDTYDDRRDLRRRATATAVDGDAGNADDVPVDEPTTPPPTEGVSVDDADLVAQDGSPLEGIGFLLDEVREALFGDDDAAAASPFDTDPVDLETETDLDLTGDGLVDSADLHEAASSLRLPRRATATTTVTMTTV